MQPESKLESKTELNLTIRPLAEHDLDAADKVMRLAFGTFIGLPDPMQFMGDADYVRTRWRANRNAVFAAEVEGRLIGSNFATNWGSVGFFGPLTIHPEFWDRGVGKSLLEPILDLFGNWGTRHAGLFTFSQSQKHVGLYQRFGFWPRFLTMLMAKPVADKTAATHGTAFAGADDRRAVLAECKDLTDAIYEGLDLTAEIETVADQNLGETILLWRGDQLTGFAVCHAGPGTEAGGGVCYIKFAAVRPGHAAETDFGRLLDACEAFAASRNLGQLTAGVNTARHEAYQQMLARGFVTNVQGVVMSRPNEPGYNHRGVYLIDDWR